MTESLVSKRDTRISAIHPESEYIDQPRYRAAQQDKFISFVKIYNDYERKRRSVSQNYNMMTNFKLKTEKQKKEVVEEKERIRRSRKDKEGRDYKCGCGKTYLSYPALYTHIKQKHQGKQPQNTTRLNSNGPSRRGRPRRFRIEQSIHTLEEGPKIDQTSKILSNRINKDVMLIFEEYQQLVTGTILIEQALEYPKFVQQIENIKKQHIKEITVDMCIDRIMAIYLHNLADLVNMKYFATVEQTLVHLRFCINAKYQKLHKSYQKISGVYTEQPILEEAQKTYEYSQKYCSQLIPLICEYFVLHYAPKKIPDSDPKILGIILQDFCNWLYDQKLTHLRLSSFSIENLSNLDIGELQLL